MVCDFDTSIIRQALAKFFFPDPFFLKGGMRAIDGDYEIGVEPRVVKIPAPQDRTASCLQFKCSTVSMHHVPTRST